MEQAVGIRASRAATTTGLVLAIHLVRYAGPLIYVPLVLRVLDVGEAGAFFRLQSFGLLLALLIEFGLSGTALRDWMRQDGPSARSRLFNDLHAERLGNALILALVCAGLFAAGALSKADLLVALPLAVASAFNMSWYFMASGRPLAGSGLEALGQLLGFAALIAIMLATRSGAAAAAGLVLGQAVNIAVGIVAARHDGILPRLGLRLRVADKLAQAPMFIVRVGTLLTSAGAPWAVATLGGVASAGFYGPPARLFGAVATTLSPIADVVLPLITRQVRSVERRNILLVAAAAALPGAAIGAALWLMAGPVATFLSGDHWAETVPVVRALAFSVPFVFVLQALSLFVLVPAGREGLAAAAIAVGAVLFVTLTWAGPTAVGAAWAKVAADGAAAAIMLALAVWAGGRRPADA
ncbi:MAG: hypothetical protein JO048_12240 [Methylobacteriaceae bacterium]|nr:hypothetical protein [Methylobacteriaceae bacterium]